MFQLEYILMEGDRERKIQNDDDVIQTDEGLVFDPFNPINKEITADQVSAILRKYNVPDKVHNLQLFQRAFIHRSYQKRPAVVNNAENITIVEQPADCLPLRTKSNERLEFVGDGVLECIVKYYLYRRFPKADEGFMTEKKIALVKNEHIGKLAYEMGLHNWYIISKHAEEKKIRTNHKKLGCLFEAFLGALFLDGNKITVNDDKEWFKNTFVIGPGFQIAQKFVENILETHVDWNHLISTDDNFKNILQVMVQKAFKVTPDYLELDRNPETGYEVGVFICLGQSIHSVNADQAEDFDKFGSFNAIQSEFAENGRVFVRLAQSQHKIKRKAEQMACEHIISKLSLP